MTQNCKCVLLFILTFIINSSNAQVSRQGCVKLYNDANYKGREQEVCNNIIDFTKFKNFCNNCLSSLILGPRVGGVTIYSNSEYKDHQLTVTSNTPKLSAFGFNDRASSLEIIPGGACAKLYRWPFMQDAMLDICDNNIPSLQSPFRDAINSVRTGKGTEIILYDQENYSGNSLTINDKLSHLTGNILKDRAKSVKIQPKRGCVWLYPECNYSGSPYVLCSSQNNRDSNFRFKSIRLPDDYRTKLFYYPDPNPHIHNSGFVTLSSERCLQREYVYGTENFLTSDGWKKTYGVVVV
jgi:hypothetical protein